MVSSNASVMIFKDILQFFIFFRRAKTLFEDII